MKATILHILCVLNKLCFYTLLDIIILSGKKIDDSLGRFLRAAKISVLKDIVVLCEVKWVWSSFLPFKLILGKFHGNVRVFE